MDGRQGNNTVDDKKREDDNVEVSPDPNDAALVDTDTSKDQSNNKHANVDANEDQSGKKLRPKSLSK